MKFLTKKKSIQKIIILFLILIGFNFVVPVYSHANAVGDAIGGAIKTVGGILLDPIVDLFTIAIDAINGLTQYLMLGDDFAVVTKKTLTDKDKTAIDYQEGNVSMGDLTHKELSTILIDETDLNEEVKYPIIKYTPAEIFSGTVPALSIDFFSSGSEKIGNSLSAAETLKNVISSWYKALRNLATVGLLSVLVYVGIRIIISTSNDEKAKYKESLKDWLIAMCLIFFLHYIMAFTVNMTNSLVGMIGGSGGYSTSDGTYIGMKEINIRVVSAGELKEDANYSSIIESSGQAGEDEAAGMVEGDSITPKYTFSTNLMGAARFQIQYQDGTKKLGYLAIYVALTIYTIMFTFTYLKRVMNMAFLTIIAPLVALTYPLDKMGDGKSQAFDMWLKEYMYNALLQPFHLLLYTVLVTAALQLASSNMLYAIVALAFILSAEKLLKEMFNFKNSRTGASLGGFAGGAIASNLFNRVTHPRTPNLGKGNGGGNGDGGNTKPSKPIKDPNAPKGIANSIAALGGGGIPALHTASSMGTNIGLSGVNVGPGSSIGPGNIIGSGGVINTSAGAPGGNFGVGGTFGGNSSGTNYGSSILNGANDTGSTTSSGIWIPNAGTSAYTPTGIAEGTTLGTGNALAGGSNRTISSRPSSRSFMQGLQARGVAAGGNLKAKAGSYLDSYGGAKNFAKAVGKGALKTGGKVALAAGKGIVKGAVVGGTAATGMAIGAGIAAAKGGDVSDILGGGFAGALSGGALGNIASDAGGKLAGNVAGTVKDYAEGKAYGYREAASKKADKEFMKNKENREYFRREMGVKGEKLDECMQKAVNMRRAGINDLDDIKKGIELQDKIYNSDTRTNITEDVRKQSATLQAQETMKLSTKYDDSVFQDSGKYNNALESLKDRVVRESGLSEAQAKNVATEMLNRVRDVKR